MQVGERYEILKLLGTGSFSSVCLALDNFTGEKVRAIMHKGLLFACMQFDLLILRAHAYVHACGGDWVGRMR